MKQEIKVYALPTEKASRLHKSENKLFITSTEETGSSDLYKSTPCHLYATTDETLKEGDWAIRLFDLTLFQVNSQSDHNHYDCKKVVATTNKDLKVNNLPQISPEFQQAWVREANKDTPIVDAMMEMEYTGGNDGVCGYVDNTVKCLCGGDGINKCYAKSAIQPKLNPQGYVTILPVKEKMYTREEVIDILVSAFLFSGSNNNQGLVFVKGNNYGEQAETIIKANEDAKGTNNSMISIVANFK